MSGRKPVRSGCVSWSLITMRLYWWGWTGGKLITESGSNNRQPSLTAQDCQLDSGSFTGRCSNDVHWDKFSSENLPGWNLIGFGSGFLVILYARLWKQCEGLRSSWSKYCLVLIWRHRCDTSKVTPGQLRETGQICRGIKCQLSHTFSFETFCSFDLTIFYRFQRHCCCH